jgi:hypothetical protein
MNRTKTISRIVISLTVFACGVPAFAAMDSFESYPVGDIHGQGAWVDFGGTLIGEVSTEQAHTGNHSLKQSINSAEADGYGSDVFQNLPSVSNAGVWNLSYWIYTPSDFLGASILHLAENMIVDDNLDFGLQLVADGSDGFDVFLGSQDGENAQMTTPLLRDTWVEVTATIDLDNNTVNAFYGGNQVYSGMWDPDSTGPSDGPTLGGFDLWVQGIDGSGSVYVDDFSLVPEPSSCVLILIGLVSGLGFVRRK